MASLKYVLRISHVKFSAQAREREGLGVETKDTSFSVSLSKGQISFNSGVPGPGQGNAPFSFMW